MLKSRPFTQYNGHLVLDQVSQGRGGQALKHSPLNQLTAAGMPEVGPPLAQAGELPAQAAAFEDQAGPWLTVSGFGRSGELGT